MDRIRSWWAGLSRRGKFLTVGAIVVLLVAASAAGQTDDNDALATGSPVAVSTATAEATTQPTSEPSPEPSPTAVPTAEPTPEPAFDNIRLSGNGDAVPRFKIPEGTAAIADITHQGGGNFSIFTVGADGANQDLLVNTIGNYNGTVLFDESDAHSVAFEITAGGAWEITIRPVTAARAWNGRKPLKGRGDDVVLLDPPVTGLTTVDITHNGDGNFAVFAYGSGAFGADLLVNEIGNYSGESLIGEGTFLMEITAGGSWRIAPS